MFWGKTIKAIEADVAALRHSRFLDSETLDKRVKTIYAYVDDIKAEIASLRALFNTHIKPKRGPGRPKKRGPGRPRKA